MLISLTIIAIVIVACVLCNKLTNKIGVPMLLAFILLGVIFGSDGIFKIPFDDFEFVEQVCTVALIFIMFYGGFGTNWKEAKPVAPKALLLSSVGVIATSFLVGIFCYYILHFEWLESLLIGAVLGSTDAASVFSVLRSKQLNLRYKTASLLELESGSNDRDYSFYHAGRKQHAPSDRRNSTLAGTGSGGSRRSNRGDKRMGDQAY